MLLGEHDTSNQCRKTPNFPTVFVTVTYYYQLKSTQLKEVHPLLHLAFDHQQFVHLSLQTTNSGQQQNSKLSKEKILLNSTYDVINKQFKCYIVQGSDGLVLTYLVVLVVKLIFLSQHNIHHHVISITKDRKKYAKSQTNKPSSSSHSLHGVKFAKSSIEDIRVET